MTQRFLEILKERGQIAQISHEEELGRFLAEGDFANKSLAVYAGFDPTAKSLHIGHLVMIKSLRVAQDCGLVPIVLFGGATGLIGDPTDRTDMRPMNSKETIAQYVENFKALTQRYFRHDVPNKPLFVNNIDWIGGVTWLDFLRDIGVHFTIAKLLAADVNRKRYEEGD